MSSGWDVEVYAEYLVDVHILVDGDGEVPGMVFIPPLQFLHC